MVAGAISVSRIIRFSSDAARIFVGVELLRFFRAGDGVPIDVFRMDQIKRVYQQGMFCNFIVELF